MDFKTTKHDEEHPKEKVNIIFSHRALMCNNGRFLHIWGEDGERKALEPGMTWSFAVTYDMSTHRKYNMYLDNTE